MRLTAATWPRHGHRASSEFRHYEKDNAISEESAMKRFMGAIAVAISAIALSIGGSGVASASVPGFAGCGASANGHHTMQPWECLIPGQSIYSGHTELYMSSN